MAELEVSPAAIALAGREDLRRHRDFLIAAGNVLRRQAEIAAVFVTGSVARGDGDPQSDLDLLLFIDDNAFLSYVDGWRELVDRLSPTIFRRRFGQGADVMVTAVSLSWLRFDMVLHPSSSLAHSSNSPALLLFERDHLGLVLPRRAPDTLTPARLDFVAEEFLRILGLLPVVLYRHEWLVATDGVAHLRRLLIDLMLIENGNPTRGGAKRLNPFLTPTQRAVLEGLPPVAPTRDVVVQGHIECARLFLRLAHAVFERYDASFPSAFEDATIAHVNEALGYPALP